MQHVEIPFIDIARQEDVERLRLAHIGRAIGGVLDHPALVDFEGGAESRLLVLVETIEMLDGAFGFQD